MSGATALVIVGVAMVLAAGLVASFVLKNRAPGGISAADYEMVLKAKEQADDEAIRKHIRKRLASRGR